MLQGSAFHPIPNASSVPTEGSNSVATNPMPIILESPIALYSVVRGVSTTLPESSVDFDVLLVWTFWASWCP